MEHHRQPTRETKECEEALQRCGLLRTRYGFAAAPQLRHGITMRERSAAETETGRACSIDIQVGHGGAVDLLLQLFEGTLTRFLVRPPSQD